MVSSPVLFCVYIDGLLTALASANVGCYIGRNYVGALAYADDLVLIAPSASALRKMLTICDYYASDFYMSFNASKSKCIVMIFPSSRACLRPLLSVCNFKIGGKVIEFVSSYSHLGHVITDSLDDCPNISKRQGDFIGQVNSVLCDFRQLPSIVKYIVCLVHTAPVFTAASCGNCQIVSQFWHYVKEKCEDNLEFT